MGRIIGLTGGIASGKSMVAKYFRSKGAAVLDADELARKLAEPNGELYRKYVAHFGREILLPDGTLKRRAIGAVVFNDEQQRRWLDEASHPVLQAAMAQQIHMAQQKNFPVIILDVPLLFEAGWDKMTEESCLVFVAEDIQLERLIQRDGFQKAEALGRIAAQMPLAEKKQLADRLIDNSGSLSDTYAQADELWKEWTHAGLS